MNDMEMTGRLIALESEIAQTKHSIELYTEWLEILNNKRDTAVYEMEARAAANDRSNPE